MSIGGILLIGLFVYGFIVGVMRDADAPKRREARREAKLRAYEKYYK